MEERVKKILDTELPGAVVSLEQFPGSRLTGSVVWDGFEGRDDVDRQQELRKILRENLGDEALQVGILLTYTSRELAIMKAA